MWYVVAPVGQIQAAVINGQRPDLLQIEGTDNFREFARTCVEKCWEGEPDQRPTFGGELYDAKISLFAR